MKPQNILLLSSRDITHSGNYALDLYNALEENGYNVDFGFEGLSEYIRKYQNENKQSSFVRLINKIRYILGVPVHYSGNSISNKGYGFPCADENKPYVLPHEFVNSIEKQYDLIIVLFTEGLISTSTLNELYNKQQCPIVVFGIDMYYMTGGCYYFNECRNFQNECYYCPVFGGKKNTKAHKNFITKKNNYNSMNICFLFNSWMKQFAESSTLFTSDQISLASFYLEENFYKPLDLNEAKASLQIPSGKRFIIGLRQRDIQRKGGSYAELAIRDFISELSEEEKNECLLLTVGEQCTWNLGIDIKNLGKVNAKNLVKFYNVSNMFLCPSIDDAGPSMVNQSQMCGTPVVAFNSGTAQDVVITGETGYKVKYKDVDDMAKGLSFIYRLSNDEYLVMRNKTRSYALKYNSKKAFVDLIEKTYIKMKRKKK